jgi:1-deoxy-D-xylulose-5-phosphate synthase
MALARDLTGGDNHVIAVIGDGAITGGMAWEAMNHAGSLRNRLIVILNDNGMSIAPAVGALNDHLAELRRGKLPSVFASLGFSHEGPVDGHDMKALLATLRRARDREESGPVLIHVVTRKGHVPRRAASWKQGADPACRGGLRTGLPAVRHCHR